MLLRKSVHFDRKKGYSIMSIRKPPVVPDYFNIAGHILNDYYNTNGHYTINTSSSSTSRRSFSDGLKIDLPDWVEKIEGYVPTAFGFPHRCYRIVVVKYMPKSTLDLPFIRVVFLDPSGNPAKCMPSVYRELVKENKSSMVEKPYRITEEGNVTGVFGIPDNDGIERVVYDIECYYDYFKDFPDETDIEVVKKLLDAKDAVRRMVMETKSEHIQSTIKSCRDEIVERQNEIAKLEKQMNEIYEEAADAMNLLEEHGIKVDISDPEKWYERKLGEGIQIEYPFNTDQYDPSKILTPDPGAWANIPCQISFSDEEAERIVRESLAHSSEGFGVSYTS